MTIREENPDDYETISLINDLAFSESNESATPKSEESNIVDKLRQNRSILHSLVYEEKGKILGHLMLSRGYIKNETQTIDVVALGPVAVHPKYQLQGIGKKLIEYGIEILKKEGEKIVILLGHTTYYPKFGFEPAISQEIFPSFNLASGHEDAFMVLFLDKRLKGVIHGKMEYDDAFGV